MAKISKGLKQAYELQDLTYKIAVSMSKSLSDGQKIPRGDAVAYTHVVKAWDSCQERIRIHRGKPLPGSCRPGPAQVKPTKKPRAKNAPPNMMAKVLPGG
jgi:hypothetical protein